MEFIRISEAKLKIVLSAADMEHYGIRSESADYAGTETRRAVWAILDEAKKHTGFDAASSRICIQMYPSRGGGCELYVTRREGNERRTAEGVRHAMLSIYRFSHLENLLAVCAILQKSGFSGESAAYAEGERCYLILREMRTSDEARGRFAFAEEYGERLSGAERLSYIEEYALPICPTNAVSTLSSLK